MRLEEFDAFKAEIKQLCATLGKAYTDQLGQAYWRALKDIPLEELEAHVERIILNATAETKFPKPRQLRDTAPIGKPAIDDPDFRRLERESVVRLEEIRRDSPRRWEELMGARKCVELVKRFGHANVFFDPDEMCWRRVQS